MEDEGFVYEDNGIFLESNDNPIYPWLNQQHHIPDPNEFLSIPRGPIVYEGFIPDESGYYEQPAPGPSQVDNGVPTLETSEDEVPEWTERKSADDSFGDPDFADSDHESQQYVPMSAI